MRKSVKGAVLALGSAAAVAGTTVVSSPAMAASTPIGACGSSYHVIDTHDLGGATMYLLYNGSYNCALTWKDSPNSKDVGIILERQSDGDYRRDAWHYSTYAGPVKLYARGTCIRWSGWYGSSSWDSGWVHCG